MGNNSIRDMRAQVSENFALRWHLQCNHYPPPPAAMTTVCQAAIDAGRDEEFDRLIPLPKGTTYKDGSTSVEASVLIETFHLSDFLLDEEDINPF